MSFRREPAINSTTWIVAADRSRARIFRSHWPDMGDAALVEDHTHPEGRMQAKEVDAGAFGRGRGPDGRSSPYDREVDHRHETAAQMAIEIAERMEAGRARNAFGHVVVVAPPLLLGELRRRFSPELTKLVDAEVDKELVQMEEADILEEAHMAAMACEKFSHRP